MAEAIATLGMNYASDTALFIRMTDMKLVNPLNNSQGMTRGATFAAAKRRKDQRLRTKFEVEVAINKLTTTNKQLFCNASRLSVWLIRVSPRKFDAWDGLPASLKSVVDGIADAFGVKDDALFWHWNKPTQAYGGKLVNDVYIVIERT